MAVDTGEAAAERLKRKRSRQAAQRTGPRRNRPDMMQVRADGEEDGVEEGHGGGEVVRLRRAAKRRKTMTTDGHEKDGHGAPEDGGTVPGVPARV